MGRKGALTIKSNSVPPSGWPNKLENNYIAVSLTLFPVWLTSGLAAQMVKNLSTMHETWVGSLRGEDPLEKRTTTHSSILAWRIPWTEEPGRLRSIRLQRVRYNWATNTHSVWLKILEQFYFTIYYFFWTLIVHILSFSVFSQICCMCPQCSLVD